MLTTTIRSWRLLNSYAQPQLLPLAALVRARYCSSASSAASAASSTTTTPSSTSATEAAAAAAANQTCDACLSPNICQLPPLDAEQLRLRPAEDKDLDELLQLQPDAHHGLDDLAAYYSHNLRSPHRRSYVAELDSRPAAFLSSIVVDDGSTATFVMGRCRPDLVGQGIVSRLALRMMQEMLGDGVRLRRSLAALCMPRYTREHLGERISEGCYRLLHTEKQLGFHFNDFYYRSELKQRLQNRVSGTGLKRVTAQQLGSLFADRPAERRLLFPNKHLLLVREPMSATVANLTQFEAEGRLGSVCTDQSLSGVSFCSHYPAKIGLVVTLNAYVTSESELVNHIVHQLGTLAENDEQVAAADNFYLCVFYPNLLDVAKVLNAVQSDSAIRNLPLSSNRKLNCKMHTIQHCYLGDLANLNLLCPRFCFQEDITNLG